MEEKSIYSLFAELPDFIRKHSIPVSDREKGDRASRPEPAQPEQNEARQTDSGTLFKEAMEGVKGIPPGKRRVPQSRNRIEAPLTSDKGKLEEALREDYTFNVVDLPEYMEGRIEGMNPLIMDKLRAGEYSAQKTLDLHGCGVQEAHAAFHEFIREAVMENIRCIKVIHGRGLKSRLGPVLKEKLKEWIIRAMHRKWVMAFASCRMAEGGPGATTILLKRDREKSRLNIIG